MVILTEVADGNCINLHMKYKFFRIMNDKDNNDNSSVKSVSPIVKSI